MLQKSKEFKEINARVREALKDLTCAINDNPTLGKNCPVRKVHVKADRSFSPHVSFAGIPIIGAMLKLLGWH